MSSGGLIKGPPPKSKSADEPIRKQVEICITSASLCCLKTLDEEKIQGRTCYIYIYLHIHTNPVKDVPILTNQHESTEFWGSNHMEQSHNIEIQLGW